MDLLSPTANRWIMPSWMRDTENLWAFEPLERKKILDRLVRHYGTPERPAFRLPISPYHSPRPRD